METLEEAAERIISDMGWVWENTESSARMVARHCAKLQQERSYSEEDMRKCWNAAYIDALAIDEETYKPLFFEDFIEQFKKK